MYRLHHEVEVSTGFTHRGPEARGCVNPVETELSDVNNLYHGMYTCTHNIVHEHVQYL